MPPVSQASIKGAFWFLFKKSAYSTITLLLGFVLKMSLIILLSVKSYGLFPETDYFIFP